MKKANDAATTEVVGKKNSQGFLSLLGAGMFCHPDGKISVVKCLIVAVVIAAVAVMPSILGALAAMAVGGVILYWIISAILQSEKVKTLMSNIEGVGDLFAPAPKEVAAEAAKA